MPAREVQDSIMRQANSQVELNRAFARQKAMAIVRYGLGGLTLTGGLSWAFCDLVQTSPMAPAPSRQFLIGSSPTGPSG